MPSQNAFIVRVSLEGIRPRIWRRLRVRGRSTLHQLHVAIQVAMGWTNSHLYEFQIGEHRYTALQTLDEQDGSEDARGMTVARAAANSGGQFTYLYDFGDGWLHAVSIEGTEPKRSGEIYPYCLAGERACPPEDSGGPHGYERLVTALANPRHREHKAMREWIGGEFDAEVFDASTINRHFAAHTKRSGRSG
jgi:hypothetical protein